MSFRFAMAGKPPPPFQQQATVSWSVTPAQERAFEAAEKAAKKALDESIKKATDASLVSPNRKQPRTDWHPHAIELANELRTRDEYISARCLKVDILNLWRSGIAPPGEEALRAFISIAEKDGRIIPKKIKPKTK